MIDSGSGSSFEFLKFQIRIQPILFKHVWKLFIKKNLNSILIKKNLPVPFICHFLFCHTHSPEFTDLQFGETIFFTFLFLAGSGTIIQDPDRDGSGTTTQLFCASIYFQCLSEEDL